MLKIILTLAIACPLWAAPKVKLYSSEGQEFINETLVERSDVIWGFDFLQDGRIIFTERGGKMGVFDPKTKKVVELSGVPKVYAVGQGGLLDVRVHSKTQMIYLTYSEPFEKDISATAFAMARLSENKLIDFKKIFTAEKKSNVEAHYGSRIEFDGKGHVFVSSGERYAKEEAQNLQNHQGKILRFNEDGSIPKDNPFLNNKKARPEIWSYGHRNPQGLVYHHETGNLWEAEFGPQGGDEVNLILPGKNYGWPVVTYGIDYNGKKIGEGKTKTGMEDPIVYWTPSISPSAITYYEGGAFPKWKGNLFLATLSSTHLHRLVMDGKKVVKQEEILTDLDYRFRNIRADKEGYLYYATDEGKIGRLIPKK